MGGGGSKGAQSAVDRARYEALQLQAERDREASERLAEHEREARNKLEDAFTEKAAVERKAHEDKMKLEREKLDIVKEASDAQLKLIVTSNEKQREIERDADAQRREMETRARDSEMRLREENELKRERERNEVKAREEQKQQEATAAINEANKSVLEMKDKAHTDITRLITENEKNKDVIMKENLRIIAEKDAANAAKLDKLTDNYQSQVREAQETAKQREDALHLERKAVDEKYRKDMETMNKLSKEEREKMTDEYHRIIEEKDREMSNNQREKDAKLAELNKNHLAHLREAHENYNRLQEESKAEMQRLHREKEDILRESAEKERISHQKMIEMKEENHQKLLAITNNTACLIAVQAKDQMEVLRSIKSTEELGPIKEIKTSLINNATESCELWEDLEDSAENTGEIKDNILKKCQAIKKNTTDLISKIDATTSLGENKKEWKDALRQLDKAHVIPYAQSVRRAIRDEETTKEQFEEVKEKCTILKEAILDLPDMSVESPELIMSRNARGAIAYTQNQGAAKAIKAVDREENIEREIVVEES